MNLNSVGAEIVEAGLKGMTLFRHGDGWMVSLRSDTGFAPYYGDDLDETVARALARGPQHPPEDDYDPEVDDLL